MKKEGTSEEIKQDLNEEGNSYTIEELKKKWNILHTQYRKEQKLFTKSKKSGSGTNDLYVPKFAYFEDLQFLNEGEIQTESKTSMDHDKNNDSVSANNYSGKTLQYFENLLNSIDRSVPTAFLEPYFIYRFLIYE